MPCELAQHWDPHSPLLLGALGTGEDARGFLQLRMKRHRWFARVLKTRDPLTFSIGWRRFQSVPVYATEDPNGRHRRACVLAMVNPIPCPVHSKHSPGLSCSFSHYDPCLWSRGCVLVLYMVPGICLRVCPDLTANDRSSAQQLLAFL